MRPFKAGILPLRAADPDWWFPTLAEADVGAIGLAVALHEQVLAPLTGMLSTTHPTLRPVEGWHNKSGHHHKTWLRRFERTMDLMKDTWDTACRLHRTCAQALEGGFLFPSMIALLIFAGEFDELMQKLANVQKKWDDKVFA